MRPDEVVDAQADLLARMGNPMFVQGVAGVMLSQKSGVVPDRVGTVVPPANQKLVRRETIQDVEAAEDHVRQGRTGVQVAYPYHVSEDMTTLVQWAASQLEDLDRFDRTLAPTGAGFARFDGGLRLKDVRGDTQVVHWLLWQPAESRDGLHSGTSFWLFNDWNEPDHISRQITDAGLLSDADQRSMGRWSFIGLELAWQDQRMGPQELQIDDAIRAKYDSENQHLADDATSTNVVRLVHAFWLLLNQTVTKVAVHDLPSHGAKRARRASLQPQVTVVTLRRVVYPDSDAQEHSTVNWTKRWIVRGHWRWQPYGPGRTLRRRIWVNPFVKGPEDAPLSADTRVYGLHR